VAFLITVLVGARRFAHAALLGGDHSLHALPGKPRFRIDDTLGNACTSERLWTTTSRPASSA
jgi:hypothetical protein